jgi:hypothetical protein
VLCFNDNFQNVNLTMIMSTLLNPQPDSPPEGLGAHLRYVFGDSSSRLGQVIRVGQLIMSTFLTIDILTFSNLAVDILT